MLPITYKLLNQRLKEVDAEIIRVTEMPAVGSHTKARLKIVEQLQSYRRQVLKELEVIDEL